MMPETKKSWDAYVESELALVTPILRELGFSLDAAQPHNSGERHLMRAVTTESGRKLILIGTRDADGVRVVIKATRDTSGMKELEHERKARAVLSRIKFAYRVFRAPEELLFIRYDGFLIAVQRFIPQTCSFLERPLSEQFSLTLSAFKAQEGAHATAHSHKRRIARLSESRDATSYLRAFDEFGEQIKQSFSDAPLHSLIKESAALLGAHRITIDRYADFLTHTDFIPQNIRVNHNDIYLLDHSSLRFGNKYEGWARFVNFMTLHNPPLADALVEYVRLNRTPEEVLALKLMRVYRLGEIIWYYMRMLSVTTHDLHKLTAARVHFWTTVLESVLHDHPLEPRVRTEYIRTRDSLRSPEEKERQKGLH